MEPSQVLCSSMKKGFLNIAVVHPKGQIMHNIFALFNALSASQGLSSDGEWGGG